MSSLFLIGCTQSEKPVACTMDVKVCPDGSAVGRVGPDCEFEPCPESYGCETSADCDGQVPNIKCVGYWDCIGNQCIYSCDPSPEGISGQITEVDNLDKNLDDQELDSDMQQVDDALAKW